MVTITDLNAEFWKLAYLGYVWDQSLQNYMSTKFTKFSTPRLKYNSDSILIFQKTKKIEILFIQQYKLFKLIELQTNKGVFANSYSLNQILIDRVQLSNTGEAPTITSVDNYIIIAWKEYVIDENDFMSQKIRFRKISGDLNQYEIQSHFGISQENLDNPDVIQIENGFAIIAESVSTLNDKVRAIQLQLFNLDGSSKSQPIIVYSISNLYNQIKLFHYIHITLNQQTNHKEISQHHGYKVLQYHKSQVMMSI